MSTNHRLDHCRDLPIVQRWCWRLSIIITTLGAGMDIIMKGHL